MVVQEALLSRERANGHNALQQLAKAGEDGRTCVRFHSPQVAPSVEVPNSKLSVRKADEECRKEEPREDDTMINVSKKKTTIERSATYATVIIDAANVAREELTA